MVRILSSQEILKKVQKVLKKFKDINGSDGKPIFQEITAFVPQTGIVGNDIEIGVVAESQKKALDTVKAIEAELASIDGVEDINDNAKIGPKELKLKINSYGEKLGVTEAYLIQSLRGLFLEAEYGKMFNQKGLIRVKIEQKDKNRKFDINSVRITNPDGKSFVHLKDIVKFEYRDSPLKIYKENAKRVGV